MGRSLEDVVFSIIGPPHGSALCWATRIMALAWVLFLMSILVLGLLWGEVLYLAFPLVALAPLIAGLRWHLVPAVLLTSAGVPYLGALLLHDPLVSQPSQWLFVMALLAGGIVNLLAWFDERAWSKGQLLAGLGCGLPGLALCVLGLWSYSGLGDDCEWGQDTMAGGIVVLAAMVGLVLSFVGLFVGMWVFRRTYLAWHKDKK
jgi:hypothetical protein